MFVVIVEYWNEIQHSQFLTYGPFHSSEDATNWLFENRGKFPDKLIRDYYCVGCYTLQMINPKEVTNES